MSIIKRLDQVIANKIAAGEVIEKIANVVKELVENSIDAKANQIDIELTESGLASIIVTDNGTGMDPVDAVLAFERHATSKIANIHDLFRIQSLGFRGEALPSIAAVSRVEMITSNGLDSIKVIMEDGKLLDQTSASANKGTKITVTKLFYTTPARFKYLKSPQYELAMIVNLVHKFALAYPEVSFRLSNNQKLQFVSPGNNQIVDIIANIFTKDIARSMVRFSGESRDYSVQGYTSNPIVNRSSNHYMHLFVNRRAITDVRIINTIRECYDQLIPKNRYPITVLYIECDPSIIDVNIHPRKQEIKFSEYQKLLQVIHQAVRKVVGQAQIIQKPTEKLEDQTRMSFHEAPVEYQRQSLALDETVSEEEKAQQPEIPDMEYIGQYAGTYLLFQNEAGLYLLDQHAAAERIRYERYSKNMSGRNQQVQDLFVPLELALSQDILLQLEQFQDQLATFGLIGEIKDNVYVLKEIPAWFYPGFELIYAEEIIMTCIQEKELRTERIIDDIAKSLSCKHSLKANHYITKAEANRLLNDLRTCDRPYTCPHGRPILVHFSIQQIERWFNRVM